MKKILYGTTALVTVGLLAASPASAEEKISLTLGGYMNQYFGVGGYDEDTTDSRDFGTSSMFSDGEIHFNGKTTLDNGITFGAQVQLESFASGDQIDENYAYVDGDFGRVLLGSENTAMYLMQYSGPEVGAPVNSGWVTVFVPSAPGSQASFRTPAISTFTDIGNDENRITYFTPRFSGFQVGASYTPQITGAGDGGQGPADETTQLNNGIALGANFVESFNGIDVAIAGGWQTAEGPDGRPTSSSAASDISACESGLAAASLSAIDEICSDILDDSVSKGDDPELWSAGINLGFSGFTVGGSYANAEDSGANDGHAWDVGAKYATGPWKVGVYYFHSEVDGSSSNPADDELDALKGAIAYSVGPGIEANFTVMHAKWEDEGGAENDGTVGIVGLKFSF
jgi:predicted porin